MKIVCETSVQNRLAPNVVSRFQQSTLALGLYPPGSNDSNNVFIILFSATNKTGTRYKIKRNIEQIFTKFISDGKTTISFKQPQHNIQIRCDTVQLKCFLQTLKNTLEGNVDLKKLGLSSLAATAVPQSKLPVKKMTILKPSEYPVKGLPRTLTSLTISGIRKQTIDSNLLNLNNLRVLQLTNNCIKKIPRNLGDMLLSELDLTENDIGASNMLTDWSWTDGYIKNTLQSLNLSKNKLPYFPHKLVKLQKLHTLIINDNEITRLPFAFRRLKNLRCLNLSNNNISALPSQIVTRMDFHMLDVTGQQMFCGEFSPERIEKSIAWVDRQPSELWQLAAKTVMTNKLPIRKELLPVDVIDLLEEMPICECGKLCLPNEFISPIGRYPPKAKALHHDNGRRTLHVYTIFCNEYCKFKYYKFSY